MSAAEGTAEQSGQAAGIVADRLSQLVPHGWYLLHGVHWPGRPTASLDHVLVGPGGVVVVDVKNWAGEVRVSSGVLWQDRYARTQSVEGALAQCAAVASVLPPPHRRLVRPLICTAGQPDLFAVTSSDVAVAGPDRVVAVIRALPPVLDEQAVVGLHAQLRHQLPQKRESKARPSAGPEGRPLAGAATRPASAFPPAPLASRRRPPGRSPGTGTPGGRRLKAQDHGTGGMAGLLFLAAFVIFAVYILPLFGR